MSGYKPVLEGFRSQLDGNLYVFCMRRKRRFHRGLDAISWVFVHRGALCVLP